MWLSLITRSCVIHFLLLINIFLLFKLNEFITYVFYGLYIGIKCSKRVDGNNKTSWRMAPYLLKIRRQRVAECLPMKISRKVAPYLQMKKRWGVAVSSDKKKAERWYHIFRWKRQRVAVYLLMEMSRRLASYLQMNERGRVAVCLLMKTSQRETSYLDMKKTRRVALCLLIKWQNYHSMFSDGKKLSNGSFSAGEKGLQSGKEDHSTSAFSINITTRQDTCISSMNKNNSILVQSLQIFQQWKPRFAHEKCWINFSYFLSIFKPLKISDTDKIMKFFMWMLHSFIPAEKKFGG